VDLASPISSVIPTAHGAVLAVLARTDAPLSGRQVAAMTRGRFGQSRVNEVLGELAYAGVVLREEHPPSKVYRLNRHHVAADGITALADQWNALVKRLRAELDGWQTHVHAAWIFGSAARGEGGPGSDIDVLIVRGDSPSIRSDADEEQWESQLQRFVEQVRRWSGNPCEVLELTVAEIHEAVARDDRLVKDLRDHAIPLTGKDARNMLRKAGR
jgi:predicted nucleotidyltransferase